VMEYLNSLEQTMNAEQSQFNSRKIKVFYDGLCIICDREISQYKRMRGSETIEFIDIFSFDFDPQKEGLNSKNIHIEMHAKDEDGNLLFGVDAFRLIWSKLEALKWAARLSKIGWINQVLKLGYRIFIHIRRYLPRKSCETSPNCSLTVSKVRTTNV
jgi:predicted DCC family thiol-disulfide oxidoreductase YuxK